MRFDLIVYPFVGALLILLMLLILRFCRINKSNPVAPKPPRRKREPKPFARYTHKPKCELCEQGVEPQPPMLERRLCCRALFQSATASVMDAVNNM